MMRQVPVLHFVNNDVKNSFIETLNPSLDSTCKLSEYRDTGDERILNTDLTTYTKNGHVFLVIVKPITVRTVCGSAKAFNLFFQKYIPGTKIIASIDPTQTADAVSNEHHSSFCMYLKSIEAVLNYLEIDDDDDDNNNIITEDVKDQLHNIVKPLPFNYEREIIHFSGLPSAVFPNLVQLISNSNINDTGVVEAAPAPVKKVKIDVGWKEQLKPKEELLEAKDERYACQSCLHYDKTIVMLPCKHTFYCDDCFEKMMESPSLKKTCPICSQVFEDIARLF